MDAAAAVLCAVSADIAAGHLEGAVRVHAAAPLGPVAGNRAALEDARGVMGDVHAAAARGVSALDDAGAAGIPDREGGFALDLDHVAVAAGALAHDVDAAVDRVAVQVEGQVLAILEDQVIRAVGGDVATQRDDLAAFGILEGLLQLGPGGDAHVRHGREIDEQLAVLQAGGHLGIAVVGKAAHAAAVLRQASGEWFGDFLGRQVQQRRFRKVAGDMEHPARDHHDVVAQGRFVVLHDGRALHVHRAVFAVIDAAAEIARAVLGHAAALQIQRGAADVDAAAVTVGRRIASDLAAGDGGLAIKDVDAAA